SVLAPRMGFLVLFTGLNVILFRGEIARVRRISRNHIHGELSRLRDAARSYRLSGGRSPGSVESSVGEDRALVSAIGEVQQAAHFALSLLRRTMGLQTAVLLSVTDRNRLEIFEAATD